MQTTKNVVLINRLILNKLQFQAQTYEGELQELYLHLHFLSISNI